MFQTKILPRSLPSGNDDEVKFEWDAETRGHILGAFFYGYLTTQARSTNCESAIFTKLLPLAKPEGQLVVREEISR